MNAAVAAQIRAEAAAAQMNDKELADKAELNYASLRRWIGKDAGNERHIDVAVLSAIADALGMTVAEIVRRAQARLDEQGGGNARPLPPRRERTYPSVVAEAARESTD